MKSEHQKTHDLVPHMTFGGQRLPGLSEVQRVQKGSENGIKTSTSLCFESSLDLISLILYFDL